MADSKAGISSNLISKDRSLILSPDRQIYWLHYFDLHGPPCIQANSRELLLRTASTIGIKNVATSPMTTSRAPGIVFGLNFRKKARH